MSGKTKWDYFAAFFVWAWIITFVAGALAAVFFPQAFVASR